jgi:hypothetical protein
MDDPAVGSSAPLKLQRACECNRLEKQFLITAYECLAPIIELDDRCAAFEDKRWGKSEYRPARKTARPSEATAGCGT